MGESACLRRSLSQPSGGLRETKEVSALPLYCRKCYFMFLFFLAFLDQFSYVSRLYLYNQTAMFSFIVFVCLFAETFLSEK